MPRAVKTRNEMRWFMHGRVLSHTAKRLHQLNGDITRTLTEAEELGYFEPRSIKWYRRQKRKHP